MNAAAGPAVETKLISPAGRMPADRRLLLPREHGAWGLVSLPFLAGALVAGNWATLRMAAAALAVFSVFLLREPLLALWRLRAAANKYGPDAVGSAADGLKASERESAKLSLLTYGLGAATSGVYLLLSLPLGPLLLLGGGAAVLLPTLLHFTVRNCQRHPALQIAGVLGLTSSSLLSYLAGRGYWDEPAIWIWLLSAAHGSASVLVVHARLEAILARRMPGPAPTADRRNAALGQAGLAVLLAILAVTGRPWLLLPFLPPMILHCWELWQLRGQVAPRVSLHRVGWMQLSASGAFCLLLVAVLR